MQGAAWQLSANPSLLGSRWTNAIQKRPEEAFCLSSLAAFVQTSLQGTKRILKTFVCLSVCLFIVGIKFVHAERDWASFHPTRSCIKIALAGLESSKDIWSSMRVKNESKTMWVMMTVTTLRKRRRLKKGEIFWKRTRIKAAMATTVTTVRVVMMGILKKNTLWLRTHRRLLSSRPSQRSLQDPNLLPSKFRPVLLGPL